MGHVLKQPVHGSSLAGECSCTKPFSTVDAQIRRGGRPEYSHEMAIADSQAWRGNMPALPWPLPQAMS